MVNPGAEWYHISIKTNSGGLIDMTVRERLLAIRLAEKLSRDPDFARRIGVRAEVRELNVKKEKE